MIIIVLIISHIIVFYLGARWRGWYQERVFKQWELQSKQHYEGIFSLVTDLEGNKITTSGACARCGQWRAPK